MAQESRSPVSFRLSAEDRRLVETVAAYQDQSVSDLLRQVILEYANHVVRTEGRDKILLKLQESTDRLKDERQELFQRAVEQVGPPRRA